VFLKIKDLLTTPEISRLTALSRELRFVNGRVSNPANLTKDNLQADPSDPKYSESVQIVSAAFSRSREFMDFALPKHVAPPLLCRYTPGMKYGAHADAAPGRRGRPGASGRRERRRAAAGARRCRGPATPAAVGAGGRDGDRRRGGHRRHGGDRLAGRPTPRPRAPRLVRTWRASRASREDAAT